MTSVEASPTTSKQDETAGGRNRNISSKTFSKLENTLLSERKKTQRPHIVRFHLYERPGVGKSIETESWFEVSRTRANEWGNASDGLAGSGFTCEGMAKLWN